MPAVLVVHPDAAERASLARALQSDGLVIRESDVVPPASLLPRYDVILADGTCARRAGLATPGNSPVPLVLLESEQRQSRDGVSSLPDGASPDSVRDAVRDALEGRALTVPSATVSARGRATAHEIASLMDPTGDLDAVAALASRALGGASVVVSVLDATRQHFLGQHGLPADLVAAQGVPLAWSGCRHAVAQDAPLVARDTQQHPMFRDIPLIQMNMFRAYAGVPFRVDGDDMAGTVCAVDGQPREFDPREIAVLELAAQLSREILARRAAEGHGPSAVVGLDRSAKDRAEATSDASEDVTVGTLLDGKYWITASLGRGGQAEVFLGRDRLSGQLVAVKFLVGDQHGEDMLVHEASLLAGMRHPGVVRMYGWGRTPRGRLFLVLEYLEGQTLAARLRGPWRVGADADKAQSIVRQVADAVEALHAHGIAHGDIKPENVMLDATSDRAVLFDFGVARMGAAAEERVALLGGTPGYSAPEQFDAIPPTVRADVYGLGALAFHLLAGHGPFADVPLDNRVSAQRNAPPRPLSEHRPGIPPGVDALLAASLSPRPEERPASAAEFAQRFTAALDAP